MKTKDEKLGNYTFHVYDTAHTKWNNDCEVQRTGTSIVEFY